MPDLNEGRYTMNPTVVMGRIDAGIDVFQRYDGSVEVTVAVAD